MGQENIFARRNELILVADKSVWGGEGLGE